MHTRSIAVAILLSLTPALLPVSALAEGAADEATTAAARSRFKEGVDQYDKGEFEAARASFLQAYALKRHPDILFNLAWSCLKSGHVVDADKYFQQFLREAQSITPAKHAEADKGLAEARTKLARIDMIAAPGTDVSLDGERLGTAPLSESLVTVEPGAHTVKFKTADGNVETLSVTALAGEKVIARTNRAPTDEEAPKPPKKHDRKPKEEAPPEPAAETPAPEPTDEQPAPPPPKKHHHEVASSEGGIFGLDPSWPFYVLGSATLVSLAGGIIFTVSNSSATKNATSIYDKITNPANGFGGSKATCVAATGNLLTYCNAYVADNNDAKTDKNLSYVAYGAAGVFAVGTVLYAILGPRAESAPAKPATASWQLVPQAAPTGGGLLLQGTF